MEKEFGEFKREKPKENIEELLKGGKSIRIHPQGYSMYPLFVPGRDEAVIAPVRTERLKRGDVALYRREGSILVLHRIWKRDDSGFYLVGDNQKEIEGPVSEQQMRGVLTEIVRNGKKFSVRHPVYRIAAGLWLVLRPVRPFLSGAAAGIRRRLGRFRSR